MIAQRRAGSHMAGWWEFPGGKLEGEESPVQALVRELREELGIEVSAAEPLLAYSHEYPRQIVHLRTVASRSASRVSRCVGCRQTNSWKQACFRLITRS